METVNASTIKRASYATLSQLCKQMGVEFKNQPKKQLIELLLNKLKDSPNEEKKTPEIKNGATLTKTSPVKIKQSAKKSIHVKPVPVKKPKAVKANKKETKSNKILAMYLKGSKVSEISEALDAHPSFVYTIISKHKAKK